MEKQTWRTLAIVFGITTFLLMSLYVWSYVVASNQIEQENMCMYDMCKEYSAGYVTEGLCTCYDYDVLGELIEVDWFLFN